MFNKRVHLLVKRILTIKGFYSTAENQPVYTKCSAWHAKVDWNASRTWHGRVNACVHAAIARLVFKQTTITECPRVDSSAITEQRFTLHVFTDVWFFKIKALGRLRVHLKIAFQYIFFKYILLWFSNKWYWLAINTFTLNLEVFFKWNQKWVEIPT